ncbi:unnamed protein product, partial [Meganyctiphanes norvegica]
MRLFWFKLIIFFLTSEAQGSVWLYPQLQEYENGVMNHDNELNPYGLDAPRPEFLAESQHIIKKEGETVTFNCATVSYKLFVLFMKKVATENNKEEILFTNKVEKNGQFTIKNVQRSDAGKYICFYVPHPDGPLVELIHTLEVQYSPRILSHSVDQHVAYGSSVTLECSAEGNPTPRITWSKVYGRLPSGSYEEDGHSMTFKNVNGHVEGNYSCKANNGIGNPDVKHIFVYVEYKPAIITENAIIRTGEGDRVELVCIVYSRPTASVIWKKDNTTLTIEPNITKQGSGYRHALVINQVSVGDFGEYKCIAENSKGFDTGFISMTDKPKAPLITSYKYGGEEHYYILTWKSLSWYPITEYQIMYRKARINEWSDKSGPWEILSVFDGNEVKTRGLRHTTRSLRHTTRDLQHYMKYNITHLDAGTDYQVILKVKNHVRWSYYTMYEFSTRKVTARSVTVVKPNAKVEAMMTIETVM